MSSIYLENFSNKEDVALTFFLGSELDDLDILLAWYGCGSYAGSAYVLSRDPEGNLCDVSSGHCSCYGLEDSWLPVKTSVKALAKIAENFDTYYDGAAEAKTALKSIVAELGAAE